MYFNDNHKWRSRDRQYLIITDDEEESSESGYRLRELVLSSPENRNWTDIDRYSLISEDFKSDYPQKFSLQDNNSRTNIEIHRSQCTQTFTDLQEQGVNTTTNTSTVHTQTHDEQLYNDQYKEDHNSASKLISLPDPKLILFANKMAKVLRVKPSDLSHSTSDELSEKYSVIYTYSLEKSKDSRSCYIECSKSHSSATSYEDLLSISESERVQNRSSVIESETSKENEMMFFLNQECLRHCYLPNETSNQGVSEMLWDFFKVYELKKFDEIIKSHLNHSDRRLKAISNRMCCKIEVIGPYKPSYLQNHARNITEWYKLVIYSNSRLRLEKSINCVQLSFPNSCFNEKLYKYNQSQHQYQ